MITFCAHNFAKNIRALKRFRHTEILQFLKASISSNITSKELKFSLITNFYKLFKCL